jgi:MoaA/NifB/PqqE/SkfB family radical SAM enzyme
VQVRYQSLFIYTIGEESIVLLRAQIYALRIQPQKDRKFMASSYITLVRYGFASLFALVRGVTGIGRTPLFISWNLTFRCNLRCAYCGAADAPRRESSTEEIKAGLDQLYRLGGRWVTFGGGEPLLRRDLGELIDYAKQRRFQVFLSSNGSFIPERIDELRPVDNINLSLDGPQQIHDTIRGAGAFDATLRAAESLQKAALPFSFQCVLANHNLNCVEETLLLAKEQGAWMMFQPATQWLDSSTKPNPFAPPVDAYRETIKHLMQLKKAGLPVANSKAGLRHLMQWPDDRAIRCLAGRLMVSVEPDGTMISCHQCEVARFLKATDAPNNSLTEQFLQTKPPRGCVQCWCGPIVELALVCSLHPEAIWNTLRRF